MAGDSSRVHGYNPIYRNVDPNSNFASFEWIGQRPSEFRFRQVQVGQALLSLDHQGHIVAQNSMNTVLNDMLLEMSAVCNNAADVNVYINHPPHNAAWLAPAVAYGTAFNIPMFDWGTQLAHPNTLVNAEARVGDLFSIVTWNPVNICRAPGDNRRNGVPGNNLDAAVLAWLTAHPNGVNAGWLAAANTLHLAGEAPTVAQVRAYLSASTATLPGQHNVATGYYSFAWHTGAGVAGLVPG